MRWWINVALLILATAAVRAAGPVDFGKAELDAALAERKLKLHVDTELSLDPPETFRITLYKTGLARVTGGDLRGLMYGLIEASEQIRATGRLKAVSGKPATVVRGVRMALRSYDLAQPWFTSDDRWRAYFQTLARSRLNRVSVMIPLAEADIERLRILSETAAEFGVDFVLGIRHLAGDPQELNARLRGILDNCPLIRGVQIEAGDEPVQLYQESVFTALRESGRRVMLDLRNADGRPDVLRAALGSGAPLSPAGFEMDAPGPDFMGDHSRVYSTNGRSSYDAAFQIPK
ncbi:MAG: hypothetical protein LAO55_12240 [Acidobacteriia bacterium]|nr:hypothetical protein [Terriglobia bacterium]